MKYILSLQWLSDLISKYNSTLSACFPNHLLLHYIKNGMKVSLIACLILFKVVKQIKERQLLNSQIENNNNNSSLII